MKSQEELAYKATSEKLDQLLGPSRVATKSSQPKDLSFLNSLSGFPKPKPAPKAQKQGKKELPEYILAHNVPIFESPETIASKLNSMEGALGAHVVKGIPTVAEIIEAIKNLKGNDRLDVSNIRNGEQLARVAQRIDMNDMRWHGGGSTTSSTISAFIVTDVFTSTSGQTSFTATEGVLSTLSFSISGAVQTPTTDYTVSGNVATVTNATWPNGIPADQAVVWVYIKSSQ